MSRPRWLEELDRLVESRTQVYLYGNTKDLAYYPCAGEGEVPWTLGSLRSALFERFRDPSLGYEIVAAYNLLDGMVFADDLEEARMGGLFDQVQQEADREVKRSSSRAPRAHRVEDPFHHALGLIHRCLSNREHPCVFVVENASQLLGSPTHLPQNERMIFLQLLKSAREAQMASAMRGGLKSPRQNLLLLECDKLTDLPPWLYLNNPFAGAVEVQPPRTAERRLFLDRYLGGVDEELLDLTDGMTYRDLMSIRTVSRRPENNGLKSRELVDFYRYGRRESHWESVRWDRLAEAESHLARRVLGQSPAVSAVADVLRRARLHLSGVQHSSRTRPRGVLFFAGPTGVGKTELAKAVAELVFSSEEACVRFDMSEFSQAHADQRLLGAPPGYVGYEEGGQLTNRLKANPFCVLLFDEIEKAHPSILDKFLQILEDGRMTDGRGQTVYFSESILIFTSNAGIYRLDPVTGRPQIDPVTGRPIPTIDPTDDLDYETVRTRVLEGVQSYFKHYLGRPELLNRIGQNIVVFDFIRPSVMRSILESKVLPSIRNQVRELWKVQVDFAPAVVDLLMAEAMQDVGSGARGVGNLCEAAVVNPLARHLFRLKVEQGGLEGRRVAVAGVIPSRDGTGPRYELHLEGAPPPA